MELKKSNEANNESVRVPGTLVGLLFVGSVVLASFSYKAEVMQQANNNGGNKDANINFAEEAAPEEEPPQETPPPPVVDVPPPPTEEIVEKENTEDVPAPVVTAPPPVPVGPKEEIKVEEEIIDFPDVEAAFPGGPAAMQKWIADNVQYPEIAIQNDDQGRVYLSFVVESDGSISNIKIERGVSNELDREAKRLLRKMPKWTPGEAKGKKARTRCRLPINFTLN